MTTESNVGARIFLIGKDATLSGLAEIQAAVAKLNAEIAAGATSSKAAAAGMDEEAAATGRLNAVSDLYKSNLAAVNVEQDALARVGKAAFFGMTAAAAVWGYESIKWAQNYQTALVQLRTQAGLTVGAMNAIGSAAMKNAASSRHLSDRLRAGRVPPRVHRLQRRQHHRDHQLGRTARGHRERPYRGHGQRPDRRDEVLQALREHSGRADRRHAQRDRRRRQHALLRPELRARVRCGVDRPRPTGSASRPSAAHWPT